LNVDAPRIPLSAALIVALGAVAAFYVWRKGSIGAAASSAGAAVVNAAGGVASGAVGAIGASVGLPTPDQTTTDPAVARWLIDRAGYFTASQWAGVPALLSAWSMPAGSGTPPPPGSAIAAAFPPVPMTTGDFTRTDHDMTPVPLPAGAIVPTNPLTALMTADPSTWGIGL
jgi:hypothetical protein